jgi:photosystem II stability/assembly factor-like uncharacterized protein
VPHRQRLAQNDQSAVRWRVCRLLAFSLVLLGLVLALPGAAAAQSDGWVPQSTPAGIGILQGVSFVDASHGWAVGEGGVIVGTTNGGATWQSQTPSPGAYADFTSVTFASATDGWAIGYDTDGNSVVVATTDGGATWSPQSVGPTGTTVSRMTFANATDGWAVGATTGADVILATTDGGATWHTQYSGPAAFDGPVTFVNAIDGWAVGADGILATTDGGATWTEQDWGTDAQLSAVAFANASDGWAVGFEDGNKVIIATTDGGNTWSTQYSQGSASGLTGVACANPSDCWAVGYDGILATADGGANWTEQYSGIGGNFNAVTFANASDGWVVGDFGIVATTNGGISVPKITGFTPTAGLAMAGDWVTVTGTGFTFVSSVRFDGHPARFEVDSDTQITAEVPAKASSGPITVSAPGGTASSAKSFVVKLPVTLRLCGLTRGDLRLGRRVTARGAVWPTNVLTGVVLTVERRQDGAWRKATSLVRPISSSGAYSWKYGPTARGSYRMRAVFWVDAKTKWLPFKVT